MISLAAFRATLYPVFKIAAYSAVGFEVVNNGKVYDVQISPTNKKASLSRVKRGKKQGVKHLVQLSNCALCHSVMVSGVCLNTGCTNSHVE